MAKGLYPVLNVASVDKSLEFYGGLGFKAGRESMGPLTWGVVDVGGAGIIIFPKEGPMVDEETRGWLSTPLGAGVVLTIGVANAEKAWARAQAIRADVDSPLAENPWGGKGFMVSDPDGYVLSVTDRFPGAGVRATPKRKPKRAAAKTAVTRKGAARKVAGGKRAPARKGRSRAR